MGFAGGRMIDLTSDDCAFYFERESAWACLPQHSTAQNEVKLKNSLCSYSLFPSSP